VFIDFRIFPLIYRSTLDTINVQGVMIYHNRY